LSHAYSLGFALQYAGVLHQSRREARLVQEWAEATIMFSREQGFIQWLEGGMILQGWALVEEGFTEEGIVQLREALAAKRAKGTDLGQVHGLGRLAEVYGKTGQVEEGLRVLAEALAAVQNNNAARYYEAELYRLKGELLLQKAVEQGALLETSLLAEAEACFRQALDVARYQRGKSLELRAAMSLSRLWQQQGKYVEARQMLTEIYGWFTEGFDTLDLQEAKTLLEALP
jgi:tetratricopeptide (TPR) repeat protein